MLVSVNKPCQIVVGGIMTSFGVSFHLHHRIFTSSLDFGECKELFTSVTLIELKVKVVHLDIVLGTLNFWHERRRCSRSPFRRLTGNDISKPLFLPFSPSFFTVAL